MLLSFALSSYAFPIFLIFFAMPSFISLKQPPRQHLQEQALRRLARDIISSVEQDQPVPKSRIDKLINDYPEPELLLTLLLREYWPEVSVTPYLLDTFFEYYGLRPKGST
jgi:hypothetical protein